MKNNAFYDVCEWIPIKDYNEDIHLKSETILKVLEVKPINFKLKSEIEQISILESYKRFLKQCNFDIQIVSICFKTDVNKHIEDVKKYTYGVDELMNISNEYIDLVGNLIRDKSSITRRFFIVIKVNKNINENISKIIGGLMACGNEVCICTKDTIRKVLSRYFAKRVVNNESKERD